MIRFNCPECGAKVKAPDDLAGKRARCPECHKGVPIPQDELFVPVAVKPLEEMSSIALEETDDDIPAPVADPDTPDAGLSLELPESLGRYNHYLICNSKDVIATWEEEKGWMVRIKDGFVKASQNPGQLPSMGNYVFIEIAIEVEDQQTKLKSIKPFTLPGAYALSRLAKHDTAILETIEGTAELNDRQVAMVRQRINAKFLPSIWDGTEGIL